MGFNNSRGLDFSMSILGANAYAERFASHSKNLAAAGAVAGREFETFLTSFSVQNQISGVEHTTLRHLKQVGLPVDSRVSTNFSVNGTGYIPVKNSLSNKNVGFTRDGTFDTNRELYLVNGKGDFLMAFPVKPDGTPVDPDVTTLENLKPIKLDTYAADPKATKSMKMALQLPSSEQTGYQKMESVTVFDSLGNIRNLSFVWEKLAPTGPFAPGATQAWKLSVHDPKGIATIGGAYTNLRVDYDVNGNPVTYGGTDNGAGGIAAGTNSAPDLTIQWGDPAADSSIAMDLGVAGSNGGVVSAGDEYVHKKVLRDGSAPGSFVNFEFDADGYGVAHFDNNTQFPVCRVPLATFNNINALREIRPSVFVPSMESGDYELLFPKEGNVGTLVPEAYEGSTASSTSVYVKMIEDQKRFVGNLKAIETIKQMLDRLEQI
jgi:flagellar hook protein FlgE